MICRGLFVQENPEKLMNTDELLANIVWNSFSSLCKSDHIYGKHLVEFIAVKGDYQQLLYKGHIFFSFYFPNWTVI